MNIDLLCYINFTLSFALAGCLAVIIHEIGHYLVGRYYGLTVTDFIIGYGHGFKFGILTIGLPLTGEVLFIDDTLYSLPKHQTIFIISAGIAFPVIIGFIVFPLSKLFLFVCLVLALINMLPFGKSDGKHLFDILFP